MSDGIFHYEQRRLENDLVLLEPFDPTVHVTKWVEMIKTHSEVFTYVSFPVIETEDDFIREVVESIRSDPGQCLYAVIDKTSVLGEENSNGKYAGTVALLRANPKNASTKISAIIFPEFQRTHVATNAVGLLLQYTLDPLPVGGLGLRRVEWECHAGNEASRRLASRMGFELEGIARWQRVSPRAIVALPVEALERRNGTKGESPGRHTAIFSIVWDEWDEKRPKVVAQMERKQ